MAGVLVLHMALHFYFVVEDVRKELFTIVPVFALGLFTDALLIHFEILVPSGEGLRLWGFPFWLFTLWLVFPTVLNHALLWLSRRPRLQVVFGLIGGPLAYAGGPYFGVLLIPDPIKTFAVLAVVWGINLPLFMRIVRHARTS